MVASKKIYCVVCKKKCSGNVLRYQNQYFHKQCFEFEQHQNEPLKFDDDNDYQDQHNNSIIHDEDPLQNAPASDNFNIANHSALLDASATASPAAHLSGSQHFKEDVIADVHQPRSIVQRASANSSTQTLTKTITTTNQQRIGANYPRSSAAPTGNNINTTSMASRSFAPASSSSSNRRLDDSNGIPYPSENAKHNKSQTISNHRNISNQNNPSSAARSTTLPHSISSPANGFLTNQSFADCAGCSEKIRDGQALIALDRHWHVWCFKCNQCHMALHGEYVAKDGRAYCEKDYQKLFGVTCVYCKRYITGKVLQAGEAHHFHPSCARCSKCGDPFVPGEEMYLQGEVTWHPRCGPGPDANPLDESAIGSNRSQLRSRADSPNLSCRSRSRSASPYSFMSRQYGRVSPNYPDSEAVGDLSRVYTISYLSADPTQGYLRRPVEPNPPKSPSFSRPTSVTRDGSRASSRSHHYYGSSRDRSIPRGMYSVLSSMRSGSSSRARSPSMMNEEAIQSAQYPGGQKPSPDAVPKIERDDFPAPPYPYTASRAGSQLQQGQQSVESPVEQRRDGQKQSQPQQRASRPRSREIVIDDDESSSDDPRFKKEEEELSKIASGIGKVFLSTLKEREKLRAWKRANLDPRNASRTPSATRELPHRMRYDNPLNASPSRDMDRPRPWGEEDEGAGDQSPTRTRSSLGKSGQMSPNASPSYGYKVVQANRSTPKPGYGLTNGSSNLAPEGSTGYIYSGASRISSTLPTSQSESISFDKQQKLAQYRSTELLSKTPLQSDMDPQKSRAPSLSGSRRGFNQVNLYRSMPNVNEHHLNHERPPKLYPYHLLATSNYRLPPDVDRCHLERHLSNDEFQYIFNCDRLTFYRLPDWRRNELKRRAKLF